MQTLRSRLRPPPAPTDALASTRLLRVAMDDGTGDELGVALPTPRPRPGRPRGTSGWRRASPWCGWSRRARG